MKHYQRIWLEKWHLVINIPFTVGGGVNSLEDARNILLNGADKVGINTGAVKNPTIILTELMELIWKAMCCSCN